MDPSTGDEPVVVWVWCGYYCVCAEVHPAAGSAEGRAVVLHPQWPGLSRLVERLCRPRAGRPRASRPRAGRDVWTEDDLPWGEPPTLPLTR